MSHWALPYIGTPYRKGASGPNFYDCLHFFFAIQRRHFGVKMQIADVLGMDYHSPATAIEQYTRHNERSKWKEVAKPSEGNAVVMSINGTPVHIGVWIEANGTEGVLHCAEKIGVVFQSRTSLRRSGWGSLHYFERNKC